MKIRVLGCSGAIAAGYKTTAFLLDDDVLIDAGTGVGDLDLSALARVDHVLLSHSHLDHVLGLPLLADSVLRLRAQAGRPPIQVHALAPTLEALRQHLFNGVIWPDFTRLPSAERPVLTLHPFEVGQRLNLGGRMIEVLSAAHTVPACGFAVDAGGGRDHAHWVYTGDTGPNPLLWQRLAQLRVSHLVIETAFSDEEQQLATISRHLCPAALGRELAQLQGEPQIHITHIKPGEVEAVMAEIGALAGARRIAALRAGQLIEL
ncbi:MAG: MBL fold metallo-hydrolase [Roseateles asaccharophilus]|uniref:Ribonuclease BN (tRNA processing enzyme) n=1 Tax=Roseateles asaccharophilus TaxID=582607 RepID=A0A4R6NC53_9BURK|nr:3',5'-cyclic-nucleotide phosphodiesterase [Roseateles asaccharophilus]MDN3543061.1 3',5'-cyclic-nucleotide phosphodiesterase [Roseateles asaccharophilus]TDP13241.1 ribonuclease BN (tRNA processing enzyme) [Roseateles asaccharophilus]